jgi:5'-3' exonuclease
MSITAYIDADWILFAAGFAGQKTQLVFIDEDYCAFAKNVTELKKRLEDDEVEFKEQHVFSRNILDEPSHFFHSAKHMIEAQLKKINDKFGEDVKPVLLMDGDGNFRNRLATIRPYKGNRAINSKPLMYNDIKKYLIDNWDAEMIYGQETDDEMAIRQTQAEGKTIIVAVDKDMLQVPGWHLNPQKGFRKVSEVQGRTFLYRQCLTGDSVDNIAGCYKVGPKKAEVTITEDQPENAMWADVVETYIQSVEKHGSEIYNGLEGEEAAIENMKLVYLRREYDETWEPPE